MAAAVAPAWTRGPQPEGRGGGGVVDDDEVEVERWASTPWAATFDLASVPYLVDANLLAKQRHLQVWNSRDIGVMHGIKCGTM